MQKYRLLMVRKYRSALRSHLPGPGIVEMSGDVAQSRLIARQLSVGKLGGRTGVGRLANGDRISAGFPLRRNIGHDHGAAE
jgi:hypothetical protein